MNSAALTVLEAAAELRCSRAQVFRLLAAGTLRRIRVGRLTLVGAESVAALLAPPPVKAPRAQRLACGFKPFTRADIQRRRVLGVR